MYFEPYIPDKKDPDYFYELNREVSDGVEKSDNFKSYERTKNPSNEGNGLASFDNKPELSIFNDRPPFYN